MFFAKGTRELTFPQVGIGVGAVGITVALGWVGLRKGLVRYRTVEDVTARVFAKKPILKGVCVHVGDGDNFRMWHRPFLRGFPGKQATRNKLSSTTLHIRIAGVDAPECAHFGEPGQPFGPEARSYLRAFLIDEQVKVRLIQRDQYGRAVANAWVKKKWFLWKRWVNVSQHMVTVGFAQLYTGTQAEYDGMEDVLKQLQEKAKRKKVGMWSNKKHESPMAYKKRQKKG